MNPDDEIYVITCTSPDRMATVLVRGRRNAVDHAMKDPSVARWVAKWPHYKAWINTFLEGPTPEAGKNLHCALASVFARVEFV